MRALGPAYKQAGNKVLFAVSWNSANNVFCQQELEACCDQILWVSENGVPLSGIRNQDIAVSGSMTDALMRYARGEIGNDKNIGLSQVTDIHITADSHLLKQLQRLRKNGLAPYLSQPKVTASVYSSMQCMLKGVCSQCLQWQIDPETGQRTKAVFACSWHDEPIDLVDIDALNERLSQNRLQEILSNRWLDYLLERGKVSRV